ncbi:O-antigen ligase family protein [Chelativorans salis]|uniref:O-antigen ligase family protein n=1 Tax=Chelativorans salis TaxID=2978478 RepID=A0ABT2LS57_9HYPH|nr:O-antigen ligase family protein [Chelativorans sp. EGI FJ00035]MCT7376934.1 O-antigen ligase family protein [Chelativorans sp. EGI FJ00035]
MEQTHLWPRTPVPRAMPAPLAAARKLEFALACAVVFLAPMNVLKLPAFYFTASDAFTCLCLATMAFNGTIRLKPLGPGTAFWIFGLVMMVGTLLVSSLLVGVVDRGLILSLQYLFAYFLLPIVFLARPWDETITLMKVFVVSMVVMAIHGIYVVNIVGETNTLFVSGSGRLQGFVERENECGALFALTVPMVLSMTAMRLMKNVVAIPVLILLGYGIMLTGSNTALYGMLFGLSTFLLSTLTPKRIFIGAIGFAAIWSLLGAPAFRDMLPAVFKKRVLSGLVSGDLSGAGTFADRMLLNEEAIRLGGEALLLGYGADQYREISDYGSPVHNVYLLIWNEGGGPALIGFIIMLSGAAITVWMAWRRREGRYEAICGFSAITLFAILINAAPHVYGRFWAIPVLLSVAPSVAFLNFGRPRQQYSPTGRKRR